MGEVIEVEEETTIETQWIAEEGPNTLSARLVGIQPEDQNDNNDERSFEIDVGPAPDEPDFSPANIEFVGELEDGNEITINFDIRSKFLCLKLNYCCSKAIFYFFFPSIHYFNSKKYLKLSFMNQTYLYYL